MPEVTTYTGEHGSATELPIDPLLPGARTTICWWLLTGHWHPLWQQYALLVVHLRPDADHPDPHVAFVGATHELLVVALNPGDGAQPVIHPPEQVARGLASIGGYLEPVDVAHQFTATDDEMRQLADLAAQACVAGQLTPCTDDARNTLREVWLTSLVRTLAHLRGETHAP